MSPLAHRLWSVVDFPFRAAAYGLIQGYRYSLSMFMGRQCRYLPTCSEFAEQAIDRHGAWAGAWMAGGRICRCHPWGGSGYEAVPVELPRDGRWYMPWRYSRTPLKEGSADTD